MNGEAGTVLVVSSSEWLVRRVERAAEPAGYAVVPAHGPEGLARHRRQRPYLICFLDVREPGGCMSWGTRCRDVRPGERYVWILDRWQNPDGDSPPPYGYLREPFGPAEVLTWVHRAEREERLARGDVPLEEQLYERFLGFLRELGANPSAPIRDLLWHQLERPLIASVLEWTDWNQSRAARLLGIHRNTLRTKMRRLGLRPDTCRRGR